MSFIQNKEKEYGINKSTAYSIEPFVYIYPLSHGTMSLNTIIHKNRSPRSLKTFEM